MRKLKAWLYITLDGVIEAPEKWVMPDQRMFADQTEAYATSDALLLGRNTYEAFAAAWPQRGSDVDNADWMNTSRKYVASTTLEAPKWHNTTVLGDDVNTAVTQLKDQDGEDITLNGSAALLRSLLRARLIDELRLYLHPLVLGAGDRLFDGANDRIPLGLSSSLSYGNGIVSLIYQPGS